MLAGMRRGLSWCWSSPGKLHRIAVLAPTSTVAFEVRSTLHHTPARPVAPNFKAPPRPRPRPSCSCPRSPTIVSAPALPSRRQTQRSPKTCRSCHVPLWSHQPPSFGQASRTHVRTVYIIRTLCLVSTVPFDSASSTTPVCVTSTV